MRSSPWRHGSSRGSRRFGNAATLEVEKLRVTLDEGGELADHPMRTRFESKDPGAVAVYIGALLAPRDILIPCR